MSFLDRIVAAITPPESDETRFEARARARALATPGDWLEQILDDHDRIEAAFERTRSANTADAQLVAQKELMVLLTGHSSAEEVAIYPQLVETGHRANSGLAYEEQAMTKIQLALLEKLQPLSNDFLEKLEHIRGAVTHHMYQEESSWLLKLKEEATTADQSRMTARFREEMARYQSSVA
jgi:hemerythrin superfamily protein